MQQVLLGWEVVLHQIDRDSGFRGDVAEADGVQALRPGAAHERLGQLTVAQLVVDPLGAVVVTSVLGAAAPSLPVLVLARVAQGLAGG